MYTIGQASARTGLGAPVIRAWERRYGVISPIRTKSGYRLYDDDAIAILSAMRALVGQGWAASEAARAISAGEIEVERIAPASASPAALTPPSADAYRSRLIDEFVGAAESTSPAGVEAALDEMFASGSFEAIVDTLVLPAAAALGDSWAAGRMSVAAEHAASAAVERRLAGAFQAAASTTRPVIVVVGLPPGSRHALGALAFAVALRRRGVGVLYLGADVPVDGWVSAVRDVRARVAVIGVVTENDHASTSSVVDALRLEGVEIVAVGGAAASTFPAAGGTIVLPEAVVEAAAVVVRAVGRRARRAAD